MNYLIVLIVDNTNHYWTILDAWDKVGISNVAIHTLTSLDRAECSGLRDDIPLIPSLQHYLTSDEKRRHVLLATTDSHELLKKLAAIAQQVMEDPKKPGEGTLFVVPVSQALKWTKHHIGKVSSRKILGLFTLLPTFSTMDIFDTVTTLLYNQL